MNSDSTCPIWQTPARDLRLDSAFNGRGVDSPRAGGRYKIRHEAETTLKRADSNDLRCLLTTWIVDQHISGLPLPVIDMQVYTHIQNAKRLPITMRRDRVLRWFQRNSSTLDKSFTIICPDMTSDENKHAQELLAWSECLNPSELLYLLDFCSEQGLLKDAANDGKTFILTPTGYDYLDRLDRVNVHSQQAFVAMWFDDSMRSAYREGIRPAVQAAGYAPLLISEKEHVNRIDDEIITEIRRSRFVVADFTSNPKEPRGGVYFEAGFAYGLGIPVIWTCHKDMINEIHFDTRQFNHIDWSANEDLFMRLKYRIEALIGQGPLITRRPSTT